MNSIINVTDVSFSYSKKRKALDRVSLQVPEKNIVGLLGPNGGGKTTLFKIISSLIRHYEGTIEICGLDQKKNLREVLSQIGVVFQSPSLDKKLTVLENLRYQGALYGVEKNKLNSRIDTFLNMLSMSDRKDDLVDELSGGLARRVEIVKSLLHQPKILLLDEPSTGLDMGVRIDLWNLLNQIRESENVTVLLTTHFIEEADRCDSISLLDQGKVICSGTPDTLKQQLSFKQFHVKQKIRSQPEVCFKINLKFLRMKKMVFCILKHVLKIWILFPTHWPPLLPSLPTVIRRSKTYFYITPDER